MVSTWHIINNTCLSACLPALLKILPVSITLCTPAPSKKHQERKAKTQEGHLKEARESEKGAKTQEGCLKEACEQERGGRLLQLERNH